MEPGNHHKYANLDVSHVGLLPLTSAINEDGAIICGKAFKIDDTAARNVKAEIDFPHGWLERNEAVLAAFADSTTVEPDNEMYDFGEGLRPVTTQKRTCIFCGSILWAHVEREFLCTHHRHQLYSMRNAAWDKLQQIRLQKSKPVTSPKKPLQLTMF